MQMKNSLHVLFSKLTVKPDAALTARIIDKIGRARLRNTRVKVTLYFSSVALSLAAFVPSLIYAMQGFTQSEFSDYLSLVFSDTGTVMASWKAFGLSLVESLPLVGVTLALATFLAFFYSASVLWRHREETRLALSM
ncbi:hypothetical protein KGQ31_01555 [Patescibacteria group bacterium]|nr:hypothetical protein [Patescibacteria group bacterium]